MNDIIISFDHETYGKNPGFNSAASLGAVAYHNWKEVSSFYCNFEEMKGSVRDPDTMKWWLKNPEGFAATQVNQEHPRAAMERFFNWVTSLPGTPKTRVFAANPASFDSGFLNLYVSRYLPGRSDEMVYRMRCLDIRTYWAAMRGLDYSRAERFLMPKDWFEGAVITHNALDDARNQGIGLMNMMRAQEEVLYILKEGLGMSSKSA